MGIKGAWTITSNEPNRFGRRWDLYHSPDNVESFLSSSSTSSKDERNNNRIVTNPGTTNNITNTNVSTIITKTKSTTDVYIDGPGLHHYIARGRYHRSRYIQYRNNNHLRNDDGTMSYWNLYDATRSFLLDFKRAMTPPQNSKRNNKPITTTTIIMEDIVLNVNVVWDGVASDCKRIEREERMGKVCVDAEICARRFIKDGDNDNNNVYNDKNSSGRVTVLGLWDRRVMNSAIKSCNNSCNDYNTNINNNEHSTTIANFNSYFAEREAESYIAAAITSRQRQREQQQRKSNTSAKIHIIHDDHKVVVLSDDTDLFVYRNVPGFVPFRSLKYHYYHHRHPPNHHQNDGKIKGEEKDLIENDNNCNSEEGILSI